MKKLLTADTNMLLTWNSKGLTPTIWSPILNRSYFYLRRDDTSSTKDIKYGIKKKKDPY